MADQVNRRTLGQVGYEGYVQRRNKRDPEWGELSAEDREAWDHVGWVISVEHSRRMAGADGVPLRRRGRCL